METMKAAQTADVDDQIKAVIMMRRAWKRTGLFLTFLIFITYAVSAQVPTADFTCTPTGFWSRTISCSDQSTGNPTGWAWFFGDEPYDKVWTLQNARADWSARLVNSSVMLSDGTIILVGGCYDWPFSMNDTWRSTDYGIHWSLLNPYAEWPARVGHSSVVIPDGDIVLTGGMYNWYTPINDIWRSTDNGVHWSLLNPYAEWPARVGHSTGVMPDGSIVLIGGTDDHGNALNDTWRSIDNGAHWSLLNSLAEWPARMGHSTVVMPDGSIVLTGGYTSKSEGYSDWIVMNDTWRSTDKGAHWTLLNSHAEWPARRGHSTVVMPDGSIVLTGGYPLNDLNDPQYPWRNSLNDTWRSTDNGAHWSLINSHAEWPARMGHSTVVMPDGSIVLMGGTDFSIVMNDTWRFDPVSSRSQNPTHTYSAPGTYNVTLRTYNSQGFSTKQKRVTVSLLPFAALIAIAGACCIVRKRME